VKNLNFETTDEALRARFAQQYDIRSATVSKKCDPSNPNRTLSMGFGFVFFHKQSEAKDALRNMQGILLDGHSLELKLSHRMPSDLQENVTRRSVSNVEQGNCTKLLVRNIPFQASKTELEQLFGAFGEIKTIRMPIKMGANKSHRGFCFVDYALKGDAKRAFEALAHSTHLYGRRLVLEWAKPENSIDEIRHKTAEKYSGAEQAVKLAKKKIRAAVENQSNASKIR
jgi:multiple RNA-binding domain-containing protein 1